MFGVFKCDGCDKPCYLLIAGNCGEPKNCPHNNRGKVEWKELEEENDSFCPYCR